MHMHPHEDISDIFQNQSKWYKSETLLGSLLRFQKRITFALGTATPGATPGAARREVAPGHALQETSERCKQLPL